MEEIFKYTHLENSIAVIILATQEITKGQCKIKPTKSLPWPCSIVVIIDTVEGLWYLGERSWDKDYMKSVTIELGYFFLWVLQNVVLL